MTDTELTVLTIAVRAGAFASIDDSKILADWLEEQGNDTWARLLCTGRWVYIPHDIPFLMSRYQVMQTEWQAVMGSNPSNFKGDDLAFGDHPVETVSFHDCQEFIDKLSAREGVAYSLPTEVEWEYACRAGTTTDYHSGDNIADLERVGWCWTNSNGHTHPVGQLEPNPWGLYDMHGNVWEWCQNYIFRPPARNDSNQILCGGGWYDFGLHCRAANRLSRRPSSRSRHFGFRLIVRTQTTLSHD